MIKFSIIMAVLLVSVGLYGSNINTSYAQNNALGQNGNSDAEQTIEQSQSSKQAAQCVSGDITALSCNNLGLQVQSNSNDDDEDKVEGEVPPGTPGSVVICHHPPGNPTNERTLSVGESAVPAHLAHGDELGPCRD
jgi:hypothetical protein